MLVIAWHFGAATMCEFSRAEFARGMRALRCDSPEKLRRKLPELRRELQDERKFKVCAPGLSRCCVPKRVQTNRSMEQELCGPGTTASKICAVRGGSPLVPRRCTLSVLRGCGCTVL